MSQIIHVLSWRPLRLSVNYFLAEFAKTEKKARRESVLPGAQASRLLGRQRYHLCFGEP
jgi:hypothetical protein